MISPHPIPPEEEEEEEEDDPSVRNPKRKYSSITRITNAGTEPYLFVATYEVAESAPANGRKKRQIRSYRCEHGRRKDTCKNCGAGYCEHGRLKRRCKDCGTGQCEHGRQKDKCKDCGTGYCEHGRQKNKCEDCGTGYCEHRRRKHRCKDCGTGYCEHRRQKSKCEDCGPGSVTEILALPTAPSSLDTENTKDDIDANASPAKGESTEEEPP